MALITMTVPRVATQFETQEFVASSTIVLAPWPSASPILSVVYPLGTRSSKPGYI